MLAARIRKSRTEDPEVRGYYRPPLNLWTVISSVFVIFPYCAKSNWVTRSLDATLVRIPKGVGSFASSPNRQRDLADRRAKCKGNGFHKSFILSRRTRTRGQTGRAQPLQDHPRAPNTWPAHAKKHQGLLVRHFVRPKCFGGFAPTLCQGQPEGFGTSLIRGAHNCCLRFPEEQLANEPWPAGKIPVLQSPLGLLQRRKGQSTILAPRCLVWVLAKRDRRLQRSFEQKAAKVSKKICASGYNTTNKCRNGYHLRHLCSSVQLKSLALQLTLLNDAFARTIGG